MKTRCVRRVVSIKSKCYKRIVNKYAYLDERRSCHMKKKFLTLLLLVGTLILTGIQVYTIEAAKAENVKKIEKTNKGNDLEVTKETSESETKQYLEDYESNLFPGLEDDQIIYQVNNGGFLYGKPGTDSEKLKEEFEKDNEGITLTPFTVAEAKEYLRNQIKKSLSR